MKFIKGNEEPQVCLHGVRVLKGVKVATLQDIEKLLQRVNDLRACPGTGKDNIRSPKCLGFVEPSVVKNRPPPRCIQCSEKRSIAKALRRQVASLFNRKQKKSEEEQKS